MDESCLFGLIGIAFLGACGWVLVATIVNFVRGRKDQRRIAALESTVGQLSARIGELSRRSVAAVPAAGEPEPVTAEPAPAPAGAAEPGEPPAQPVGPSPGAPPPLHAPAAAAAYRTTETATGEPAEPAAGEEAPQVVAEPSPPDTAAAGPPPTAAEADAAAAAPANDPAPAATPAVPAPPPPLAPTPPAASGGGGGIPWERWVGVRGAAVLGAVALALAGILFFQYAIEHGMIPPIVRVSIGLVAGVAALLWSEALRRRDYGATADALAGAGVVILYAALWAGRALYELLPVAVAFALMGLVTLVSGLLAWRHRSQVIATLGLVGGFLTPLLLSTGSDRPVALFSYLLLLDVALLVLARRRGWPGLALLGVVATALYQAGWILGRMDADRMLLGLGILGVFGALFAFGARPRGEVPASPLWRMHQAAGILLPFLFALYFAGNADLGPHLWPLAGLLGLLALAAGWMARGQDIPWLVRSAAAGAVAVVTVWWLRETPTAERAWEAVAVMLGLALVFHVFAELDLAAIRRRREGTAAAASTAGAAAALAPPLTPRLAAGGFLALAVVAAAVGDQALPWPWLTAGAGLAALLLRQSAHPGGEKASLLAGGGLGLGLMLFFLGHLGDPGFPPPLVYLGVAVGIAAALQLLALARRSPEARQWGEWAAAIVPLTMLLALLGDASSGELASGLGPVLGGSLVLALLAVLVATRLGSGALYAVTAVGAWMVQASWALDHPAARDAATAEAGLALLAVTVALFTLWPLFAGARFAGRPAAWATAVLAAPLWFVPLGRLYETAFGEATLGLLPIGLGAMTAVAAARARHLAFAGEDQRKNLLAWFAAVALGFGSVAIPLQLEKEWVTVGWALEALAVVALWRRIDHLGLKAMAGLLAAAVSVRLLLNPAVLGYHAAPHLPVLNWLAYTYLVPAAALLGGWALLRPLETARARPAEAPFYRAGHPLLANACALAAILVTFAWINLTILDAFSPGQTLAISWQRLPARDLTLSLAWAVYALVLLALGMRRGTGALRWLSLAFLLLTIGKVFLYDLGELEDLYRVASLLGLAASLILVSLAYQRFVFRRGPASGGGENEAEEDEA